MSTKRIQSLDYILKNKNGLKEDFIKENNEDEFKALEVMGLIRVNLMTSNKYSWKITKEGYDWSIIHHPELKYKHWTTKVNDFINYWVHYRWIKKEYLENQKRKDDYFK